MNHRLQDSRQFPRMYPDRPEGWRSFVVSHWEGDERQPRPAGLFVSSPDAAPMLVRAPRPGARPVAAAMAGRPGSAWAVKTGKMWAKARLWDRPFWVSKLRQQGRPTILRGIANPTISSKLTPTGRDIRPIPFPAGCCAAPQRPYFPVRIR